MRTLTGLSRWGFRLGVMVCYLTAVNFPGVQRQGSRALRHGYNYLSTAGRTSFIYLPGFLQVAEIRTRIRRTLRNLLTLLQVAAGISASAIFLHLAMQRGMNTGASLTWFHPGITHIKQTR